MIPLVKTNMPPKEKLLPALEKVLYSGYISQGEQVEMFEKAFQNYIGNGYSLSVNSGTSALHIALILSGVKPGNEVISTALTAEPTNVAIKMVGAKIRYADIDYQTGNISPKSIEENINSSTKAIMVVDYAGIPVNVPEIQRISKKYNIPVIHDAAHGLGGCFDGIKNGNHFPYTVFSFQAIKHLTTIDGGMLQILDKDDFEKGKLIRWFGIDKKLSRLDNNIQFQGFKYHMNNVNATVGLIQLEDINSIIQVHIDNGRFYDKNLIGVNGVELIQYYPKSDASYWLYTLKAENRDGFIAKMQENGITATELHKRSDLHNYLNDFKQNLPELDRFYSKLVHIPCGWWISNDIRQKIITLIKEGW